MPELPNDGEGVEQLAIVASNKIMMDRNGNPDKTLVSHWLDGYKTAKQSEKKFGLEQLISIINEIGFIKTTSKKLNDKDYQPFITDEDGEVWTINKEHLLNYIQSLSTTTPIDFEVEMEDKLVVINEELKIKSKEQVHGVRNVPKVINGVLQGKWKY